MAKKREYSSGKVIGYERLKEEAGGGERSRKVKRRFMYFESSTQNAPFCWSSRRTWISDSSERRKNPSCDGSGGARVEDTATDDTLMVARPMCVKPNRSNKIIGRESELIFSVLISAVESDGREMRRNMMKCNLVIFTPTETGGGWWR